MSLGPCSCRLAAWWAGVVVCGLATGLMGCGTRNPHPVGSYERALHFHERGKLRDTVAALDAFLRRDPPDSIAAPAQRLKALVYMDLEEYPLAVVEWQILRREYPGSEYAGEALFREGVAQLRQVGRLERDIAAASTARGLFRRYLSEQAAGPFREAAAAHLRDISDMFVRKKLAELDVYRQLGHEEAGGIVLDALLEQEPDSRLLPTVLWRRAELALKYGEPEVAQRCLTRLVTDHAGSPEATRARRELGKRAGGGS